MSNNESGEIFDSTHINKEIIKFFSGEEIDPKIREQIENFMLQNQFATENPEVVNIILTTMGIIYKKVLGSELEQETIDSMLSGKSDFEGKNEIMEEVSDLLFQKSSSNVKG